MDYRGIESAVIEHDVTLLYWFTVDRFESDDVAVLNRGSHAASAHAQLDWQAAGQ